MDIPSVKNSRLTGFAVRPNLADPGTKGGDVRGPSWPWASLIHEMPGPSPHPESPEKSPGLYIHVPFCVTKCPYCAFASTVDREGMASWALGIRREARQRIDGSAPPFGSLYLGGGTPSAVPLAPLTDALSWIEDGPGLVPGAECTIEVNPGDVDPASSNAWRALGFNRVSVGVQAMDDATLAFLGRRHDVVTARAAVQTLRQAGFLNLGIDLIYGLPGQDARAWERALQAALALAPDHISCYGLTLEPGTRFAVAVARGDMPAPDDERVADLFLLADHVLTDAGYEHYEVSNYALPGRRARHNASYWDGTPYIGLGPAAHSFRDDVREWNAGNLATWLDELAAPERAPARRERLDARQRGLEILALGLRTRDGIAAARVAPGPAGDGTLSRLIDEGLLLSRKSRLVPTPRGMLVADAMARVLAG